MKQNIASLSDKFRYNLYNDLIANTCGGDDNDMSNGNEQNLGINPKGSSTSSGVRERSEALGIVCSKAPWSKTIEEKAEM